MEVQWYMALQTRQCDQNLQGTVTKRHYQGSSTYVQSHMPRFDSDFLECLIDVNTHYPCVIMYLQFTTIANVLSELQFDKTMTQWHHHESEGIQAQCMSVNMVTSLIMYLRLHLKCSKSVVSLTRVQQRRRKVLEIREEGTHDGACACVSTRTLGGSGCQLNPQKSLKLVALDHF